VGNAMQYERVWINKAKRRDKVEGIIWTRLDVAK
jgi:hypothetical protein